MKKQEIEIKMTLPYADAVAYMEDLLNSLKSGTIVVKAGDDYVTLAPSENVTIEVEAKSKKGKQKFEFELTWTEGTPGKLSISDREPAIPAPPVEDRVPATKKTSELAKKTPAKTPAKKADSGKTPKKSSAGKKKR